MLRNEPPPQLGITALGPNAFTAWRMLKARIDILSRAVEIGLESKVVVDCFCQSALIMTYRLFKFPSKNVVGFFTAGPTYSGLS